MKALGLGLLLTILAVSPALAAEDGGQPMAFSKLAVGARPAAMGRAFGAVGGDAYGIVSNPALLATLQDLRVGSQWATLASGRGQQFLGFGRPFEPNSYSAYGLAFHRTALDEPIEKRRANTPDPESTFSESASIFTAGLAGWLWPKKLAIGGNLKVLGQTLGEANAGGFGGDLGFFMQTWPWLDLGLVLQDIGSRLSWNTGYVDSFPMLVRSSAVLRPWGDRLLLSTDIEKSQAQDLRVRLGSELWLLARSVALRVGWNSGQWTAGTGWRTKIFSNSVDAGIDYALAGDPLYDGALQHRISLDLGLSLN